MSGENGSKERSGGNKMKSTPIENKWGGVVIFTGATASQVSLALLVYISSVGRVLPVPESVQWPAIHIVVLIFPAKTNIRA